MKRTKIVFYTIIEIEINKALYIKWREFSVKKLCRVRHKYERRVSTFRSYLRYYVMSSELKVARCLGFFHSFFP